MKKHKKCLVEEKHADMGTRVETCWCCHLKIGPSYQERLDAKIAAVPKEVHQQILDLMWIRGNNVGKVCEITGLETEIVFGIVMNNHTEHKYHTFNTKAI